jgi:hypothetical protein
MKTKSIPFAEFRQFLQGLGFQEKRTDSARIFHRAKKDLFVFRCYRDDEDVDPLDMQTTRRLLDWKGFLDAADFDAFLERGTNTA